MKTLKALFVLLIILTALTSITAAQNEGILPRFEASECPFDASDTVECGFVVVPEDVNNPEGRTIRLAVAIFRSESPDAAADPVFFMSGGPGEKVMANANLVNLQWGSIFGERDLVVFDQRGVGLSEPSLECPELFEYGLENPGEVVPFDEAREVLTDILLRCGETLQSQDVNLSAYTTTASAADVNAIRVALGYDQINLMGLSYGTRLGAAVIRDYPDIVRSAIFDSVIPLQVDRRADTPAKVAQSRSNIFAACAADPACDAAYPDLETVYFELLDQLNENPLPITLNLTDVGEVETLLNGDAFAALTLISQYFKAYTEQLPRMIYETRNGDTALALRAANLSYAISDSISMGLFYATECRSEIAFSDETALEATYEAYPEMLYVTGVNGISGVDTDDICASWGLDVPSERDNDVVSSDTPVLLMSGAYDPVTPPEWSALAAETLPNSFRYVFPGYGHSVIGNNNCARTITSSFIENPTETPDDACIADEIGLVFDAPADPDAAPTAMPEYEFTFETQTLDDFGIEIIVPEAWIEAAPGTFVDMQTGITLLQQAVPGMTADALSNLLMTQLGIEALPENSTEYETDALTWTVYEMDLSVQGQDLSMILALAENEGAAYVVLLLAEQGQTTALADPLLYPALDAFTPVQ